MHSILFLILIQFCISTTSQHLDEFLLRNIENSLKKINPDAVAKNNAKQFGLYNNLKPEKFGLYSPSYGNNYGSYNELDSNGHSGFHPKLFKTMNFLEALESIALHDSMRCIPKLLCDFMVERTRPNYQQSSLLPNIDLSSLLSYVENIGQGATESPLLLFGKAAMLGYSAKGNSYQCIRAYPRCPNDPDELLDYLNNHNGGFFRFFNGLPNRAQHGKSIDQIQKRIQTKPTYATNYQSSFQYSAKPIQSVQFPLQNDRYPSNNLQNGGRKEYLYINGRFIPYNPSTIKYTSDSHVNVPNYSQVGVIFPDRTGTGELLLDSSTFNNPNYKHKLKFPY